MSRKLKCFVVAPIGETGSQIRRDSDDLLDLIIKPSVEMFNIEVIRGDHRNESGQIDVDVIKLVQESELCIVDLSYENVNVYYELGRRDECGKPVILLKSSASGSLPVDIATRRYIEFNLDDRRALVATRDKIKEAVQGFIDEGMEATKGTSLYAISETIERIDRNLARLLEKEQSRKHDTFAVEDNEEWENEDPHTLFKVALLKKNVPMAEYAMSKLIYMIDEITFFDFVVEQVAAMGSNKAGRLLIDNVERFVDMNIELKKKTDYIKYLVTYLNKSNEESQHLDIIEPIALRILNEDGHVPATVYNQLNRLYYGAFCTTDNELFLDKAIMYVEMAQNSEETPEYFYAYNLATCYAAKRSITNNSEEKLEYLHAACEYACKAVEIDKGEHDEDHIVLACKLLYELQDPKWLELLELLKRVSPNRALLLSRELKR